MVIEIFSPFVKGGGYFELDPKNRTGGIGDYMKALQFLRNKLYKGGKEGLQDEEFYWV